MAEAKVVEAPGRGPGPSGFESHTVHQADVAQLVEAPPSEGGLCGFESLRRYQLDVVFNVQHAGFGRREWRFPGGSGLSPELTSLFAASPPSSLPQASLVGEVRAREEGGAPLRYCRTVIDIIGMAGGLAPVEPENGLLEKLKTPPSSATIR